MRDSNPTDTAGDGENGYRTHRRQVLRGLGAVGLGSSVTGLAQATNDDSNSNLSESGTHEIPISTQFWTYNANSDKSVAELIRESAAAGYDAVEPFYLDDEAAIATALEETDMYMSSAHVGVGALEENFDELAQTYSDFGASALIHAYQGRDTFSDEDSLIEFANRISSMADRLADWGIEYGYHNHNHEFEEMIGDTPAYDIFAEHVSDNVHLQLDVGWALVGGANPVSVLNDYSDKIGSLHMKDMTTDGDFTEIGEGDVAMKALANVARGAADIDFLIYEYDGAPQPIESMNTGAEFLERWNGPRHRHRS